MPSRTLPISVGSVVDELGSKGVVSYLSALGDAPCLARIIKECIAEAQSFIEIELGTRFFQTRFQSRPTPLTSVRGADYDEVEDAYDYVKAEFDGYGTFRTKCRPIESVQKMEIRYGGREHPVKVVTYPDQWIMQNARMGIINIVPLIGMTPAQTSSLMLLPITGAGLGSGALMPLLVAIDYTAGFLPQDYDPEDEDAPDPRDASPDQDVVSLLRACRFHAVSSVLGRFNRAIAAGGGSANMYGFSQNFSPARFLTEQQDYERRCNDILALYKRNYAPPQSFVM